MTKITIEDHEFRTLKDKVVLITGGSSGIGLATALLVEQQGAKVVVGDINPLPADAGIEGKNISYLHLDVTSWESQSSFFKKAHELNGRIDHVFASAGVAPKKNFLDEEFDESGQLKEPDYHVIDVDQKTVMNTTVLALHYMKKQSTGASIVVASSIAGIFPFPELDYSVAKHAVFGFMRSIDHHTSREHARIRCNAVAPTFTVTNMVPAALAELGAVLQRPGAVARAVALLMADEGRRGQTVLVHDGEAVEVGEALREAVVRVAPRVAGPECVAVFDRMKDWAAFDAAQKGEEGEGK